MDIIRFLLAILQVFSWLIVARVIISWVARDSRNEVILWILKLTEPILRPLRAMVPVPGLDLSPLLAWLLIRLLMNLIARG